MDEQVALSIRWKAFDAAMDLCRNSDGHYMVDVSIVLDQAHQIASFLDGAPRAAAAVEDPIADEIPFMGEGEPVPVMKKDHVIEVNLAPVATEEPPARKPRASKPGKKKSKPSRKAREAAPVESQETGNQVPNGADHLPANDAADIPQAA